MKKKIKSNQIFYLTLAIVLPTLILSVPAGLAQDSKHVAWVPVILIGFIGGGVQYILLKLSCKFSSKSIVHDCKILFGSFLGKIILLPYIFIILYDAGFILFEVVHYISFVMPEIAYGNIYIIMSLLATYLAYAGIEVLARVTKLGMIMVIVTMVLIVSFIIFNLQIISFDRLQPMVFNLKRIAKGSILPNGWFLLIPNLLLMLKPYVKNKSKFIKYSLLGNLFIQIIIIILFLLSIAVFGVNLTANLAFPFYDITKLTVRGFEIVIFFTWVIGATLKLGVFYFVSSEVVAQWFDLRDYKRILIPIVVLITSLSLFQHKDLLVEANIKQIILVEVLGFYAPIPIFLIISYLLLGKKSKSS